MTPSELRAVVEKLRAIQKAAVSPAAYATPAAAVAARTYEEAVDRALAEMSEADARTARQQEESSEPWPIHAPKASG